jgi:hypothetical protein
LLRERRADECWFANTWCKEERDKHPDSHQRALWNAMAETPCLLPKRHMPAPCRGIESS